MASVDFVCTAGRMEFKSRDYTICNCTMQYRYCYRHEQSPMHELTNFGSLLRKTAGGSGRQQLESMTVPFRCV